MENIGKIDSKYRYIIIAAKRAKQLLKGARSKIKSRSRNPIRIAQEEVLSGSVNYEVIPVSDEAIIELDEGVPVSSVVVEDLEEIEEKHDKSHGDDEETEIEEEEVQEEGEEEPGDEDINGFLKEDKDE